MDKCKNCKIEMEIEHSEQPACCAWYLEHVVICGESVDDCNEYIPVN